MAFKLFDTILFNDLDFYYVDTNVIFYKKFKLPAFPKEPIFMLDSEDSYNFRSLHFLCIKAPIFPCSNAGFMFFPNKEFDLDYIKKFLRNSSLYNNIRHSWAEQIMWSFLAAKSDKVNIFGTRQVGIASSKMKVSESTIVIHFVKPIRHAIEKFRFLEITQDDLYVNINLIEATKRLNFRAFTSRG